MIPYALDPSLHAGPPAPDRLGDGFEPPPGGHAPRGPHPSHAPQEPNTSGLPVQPEFGPDWRPAEPEDPGVQAPLP